MKKLLIILLLATAVSPDFAKPGRLGIDFSNYCDCVGVGNPKSNQSGYSSNQQNGNVVTAQVLQTYFIIAAFMFGIEF